MPEHTPQELSLSERLQSKASRRSFLKWTGASVAVMTLAACDDDGPSGPPDPEAVMIDLSTDTGVLNFAYALEQLEAAFYIQVIGSFYSGASPDEQSVLRDLRDHEVVHRELYEAALGNAAIGELTPDFSAIDFDSRASVLQTAQTFEDLGVAAYNGAGKFLSNADFLTVAGKIVSVEARHASVIRTLLGNSFAPDAFDAAMSPPDVLNAAGPFIENVITLQGI